MKESGRSHQESSRNNSSDRFTLDCGDEVWIETLEQRTTYGGMLEGYPCRRINESLVKRQMEKLRKRFGKHVLLIEPNATPRPEKSGFEQDPWMELPSVQCISKFQSRSVGEFGSRLTVLWYQHDFAMPIDDQVLQKIQSINWSDLAEPIEDF